MREIACGTDNCAEYLSNESGLAGFADIVCLPETTEEVSACVRRAKTEGLKLSVQGSRTSICQGVLPQGGLTISLSKMKGIGSLSPSVAVAEGEGCHEGVQSGARFISVAAGVTCGELKEHLLRIAGDEGAYFFPPNPTEETASIGGLIACGSMGSHLHGWGTVENHIESMRIVTMDGEIVSVPWACQPGNFRWDMRKSPFVGYNDDGADCCIITEVTLRLQPMPQSVIALFLPFSEIQSVEDFLSSQIGIKDLDLKGNERGCEGRGKCDLSDRQNFAKSGQTGENAGDGNNAKVGNVHVWQAEYIDMRAITKVMAMRDTISEFQALPEIETAGCCGGLLIELAGEESGIYALLEEWSETESLSPIFEYAIIADSEKDLLRLDLLRHAVIKYGNLVRTDMYREHGFLSPICDIMVPSDIAELIQKIESEPPCEIVFYGHLGVGHAHLHFCAKSRDEYEKALAFTQSLEDFAVSVGGGIATEFGKKDRL
jgi:D-lactate dehydrogenase (cytochrome)